MKRLYANLWLRTTAALLLAAGTTAALFGQILLMYRRDSVWTACALWVAGSIVFVSFLLPDTRSRRTAHVCAHPVSTPGGGRVRWVQAAAGLMISILAGLQARRVPLEADFSLLLYLWLCGVFVLLLACAPALKLSVLPAVFTRRIRQNRADVLWLCVLAAASLTARALHLEHLPPNVGGDEGTWGMEGLSMLATGMADPFATRWFSFPSMSFLAWGCSMQVFGQSIVGLRMLSALIGAASVCALYLLVRELWGRHTAVPAALFLTFGHYHMHFSRLAVNNIADPLLVALALWLLVRGIRRQSLLCFALCGAVAGLGWYGYFGARLITVLVPAYLLWDAVYYRRPPVWLGERLLVLLMAALVVTAPLLIYYLQEPHTLNARLHQVNIFSSGWLQSEQAITGSSAIALLGQQVWKSITAFHYTLDTSFYYRGQRPLLDCVSAVFAVAGLLLAAFRWKTPACFLVLLWLCAAIFFGWVITENPPQSPRLLIITPALAVLAALGLRRLLRLMSCALRWPARVSSMITAGVLIAVAALNVHYYVIVYTPKRVYGNPTAEIATVLARRLEQCNQGRRVYFYGAPVMYWDFGTLRFMARDVEGFDVLSADSGVPRAGSGADVRFIFLEHRLQELQAVRDRYPHGCDVPVFSDVDGRLLFVLYEPCGVSCTNAQDSGG